MGQVALERMDRWEQNIPIRRRQNTTRRRVSFWNSYRLVKQIRLFGHIPSFCQFYLNCWASINLNDFLIWRTQI